MNYCSIDGSCTRPISHDSEKPFEEYQRLPSTAALSLICEALIQELERSVSSPGTTDLRKSFPDLGVSASQAATLLALAMPHVSTEAAALLPPTMPIIDQILALYERAPSKDGPGRTAETICPPPEETDALQDTDRGVRFNLSSEALAGITNIARCHGTSSAAVLLAALLCVMSRYADTFTAFVSSSRPPRKRLWRVLARRPATDDTFGRFARLLAVDLAQVIDRTEDGSFHLAQDGKPWVSFSYSRPDASRDVPPEGTDGFAFPGTAPEMRLHLQCRQLEKEIVCRLQGGRAFAVEFIEHFAALFSTILTAVATNERANIGGLLATLSDADLLGQWERHDSAIDPERSLPSLLLPGLATWSDRIAADDGFRTITYADLAKESAYLARRLSQAGVGKGAIVGVFCERSIEMVVALLAIMRAGAAYLPLQPDLPGERISFMADDADIVAVLHHPALKDRLPALNAPVLAIETNHCPPADYPDPPISADDIVYVIYTSGSTGRPKGAANTHRGICNRLMWIQSILPLNKDDVVLQKTPFGFDVSVWEFFWPLLVGAQIAFARPGGHNDPEYIANTIAAKRITLCHFVPSMLRVFLEENGMEGRCNSLRNVLCSGESLPGALRDLFFSRLPGCRLHNLYGPTEAAIDVSYYECRSTDTGASVPIGRPAANTILAVVDEEGWSQPIGSQGELVIGGAQLALRYINRMELTAERFYERAYGPSGRRERFYKTGDIARFNFRGEIEYLGRTDHQVKIRGIRIELGEIEAVAAQHPSVRECIVTIDDRVSPRIIANVVPTKQASVDTRELKTFLSAKLIDAMVPSDIRIWESLPLTVNGKADRAAVARRVLAEPPPAAGKTPITPWQRPLADIWSEVLHLSTVHADDNFFDQGGDSLLAAKIANRVRARFGVAVGVADVLAHPTLRGLSAFSQNAPRLDPATAPAAQLTTRGRLSPNQQRLFFLSQYRPGSEMYNVPLAFRVIGNPGLDRLQASIDRLVEQHEVLRIRFDDSGPVTMQAPADATVLRPRLQILDNVQVFDDALRIAERVAHERFDLGKECPFRAIYVPSGNDEGLLLLVAHHIAIDGRSEQLIVDDLFDGLDSRDHGRSQGNIGMSFLQFADAQRDKAEKSTFDHEKRYWREKLAGSHPSSIPPMKDGSRQASADDGHNHYFMLSCEASAAARALARDHRTTPYNVILSAFSLLLSRYSGEHDLVIGTTSSFRPSEELENVVGFFVNTLPIRVQVPTGGHVDSFLGMVASTVTEAFAHQDLPFEQIVALAEHVDNHVPLFNVLFSFEEGYRTTVSGSDYRAEAIQLHSGTAQFDLSLLVSPTQDGLFNARFEYRPACYPEALVAALARQLSTTLVAMASDTSIDDIDILNDEDKRQAYETAKGPTAPRAQTPFVHEEILARARTCDRPAIRSIDAELTYAQLAHRSSQIATCLKRLGIRRGDIVAVEATRQPDTIAAFLAILRIGAAYLPLDPQLGETSLRTILVENDIKVMLAESKNWPALDATILDSGQTHGDIDDALDIGVAGDDLAYVIYTSGSTGIPNGVAVSHANLRNSTLARLEYYDDPVGGFLLISPFYFDSSVAGIYWTLLQGGTIVLPPHFDRSVDLGRLDGLPNAQAITHLLSVPSLYQLLLEADLPQKLDSLKVAILAGEKLEADVVNSHFQRFETAALYNEYGPTEATVWCTAWKAHRDADYVPIGRPISNTRLYVLDDQQRMLPVGALGEIFVGGANVSKGYVDRAVLNEKRFLNCLLDSASETLYRTGDVGRYRPDGSLEYFGRRDNQIKLRGQRIEPEQIESVLNSHPCVRQSAVVLYKTAETEHLVAYVVQEGGPFNVDELRQWIKDRLPDYFCPSFFVPIDHLPRSATGKINRKELARTPPPITKQGKDTRPLDHEERLVADIWRELLRLDQIDPEQNFFHVGGHSLLLMRLQRALSQHSVRAIEIVDLFRNTTVATQASLIRGSTNKEEDAMSRPEKRQSRRPADARRTQRRRPSFLGEP